MMVPAVAVDVVKRYEGLHKVVRRAPRVAVAPYICPAGYWTIGYGHLCSADHPVIDEAVAEQYLRLDLKVALDAAARHSPLLLRAGDDRLGAIVSFIFNLGAGRYQASTLRRRVNEGAWPAAAREIRRWVYAGGKKLPGLVARREVEALMLEGVNP